MFLGCKQVQEVRERKKAKNLRTVTDTNNVVNT